MNPADLVTPQLIDSCKNYPIIVICGYTKTGKVTIAKKLASELNRKLFISDDYIEHGPVQALYVMMDDILAYKNTGKPFIVEGILCFRLLRKGVQLKTFKPDLIIKTECNDETITHFYKKDGEGHKIPRALNFNKGLNTIWEEYLSLLLANPSFRPKYITLNTSL